MANFTLRRVSEEASFITRARRLAEAAPGTTWYTIGKSHTSLQGMEGGIAFSSYSRLTTTSRGTKGSYQLWADRVGNQAYTFDALLPYFQKSVTFSPPNNLIRPANATPGYVPESFGSSGPVQVSYPNHANAFSSWAELALKELGIPDAGDLVSGSLDGYQYIPMAISSQTRSSAETAYLRQALSSQRRLTVYKNTLAKKILFDGQKKATGVLVDTSGVQYLLSATREVILSAGAHRSPQLLMVSGIGPRSALQPLKIPIVAERNGVGQEMWVSGT